MSAVLIIQGAGMEQRGTTQVEIFGPETLDQINAQITASALASNLQADIVQFNDEQALVNKLGAVTPADYIALIINPGGFTTTTGPLPEALKVLAIPAYEVHASNPASRGVVSTIAPFCKGAMCGFGYAGYGLALQAIREQLIA